MQKKQIAFSKDFHQKILNGVKKLSEAVAQTLGPRSYNVVLDREYPSPLVVHDGVTVAREIRLEDKLEDMGARIVAEAAGKTNDLAGDGTTTATVIASTLYEEGLNLVSGGVVNNMIVGKYNPMKLREQLLAVSDVVVSEVKKRSVLITLDSECFEQVAHISGGMPKVAEAVIEAVRKVGDDGVVMVEESATLDTYIKTQEGYEFDNGMTSPYFATDEHKLITQFKQSYVLICDYQLSDPYEIVDIIQAVKDEPNTRSLIIIADSVVGAALQTLVGTKVGLGFQVVAVNAPEFGDTRRAMLEDLAILTGATPFFMDKGKRVKDAKIADLGRAQSVLVTQTHTTIAAENTDHEELKERLDALVEQLQNEDNPFRQSRLQKRISKLKGGIAMIYAGGATVTERKEIKERIIDAVNAVKAASAEGVVAGGGVVLRDIADELEALAPFVDKQVLQLATKALKAPYQRILSNAGEVLEDYDKGEGLNVVTKISGDMLEMGVLDPSKVTRLAVTHAFSVAAMLLTTNTGVYDIEDKKDGK